MFDNEDLLVQTLLKVKNFLQEILPLLPRSFKERAEEVMKEVNNSLPPDREEL